MIRSLALQTFLPRLYFDTLPEVIKPKAGDVMFVDVGVYGHSDLENYVGKDEALRRFEKFTLEHEGFQALYAETLMTKEEFVTMFPRQIYEKVRAEILFTSILIKRYFRLADNFLKRLKLFRRSSIKSAGLAEQKLRRGRRKRNKLHFVT